MKILVVCDQGNNRSVTLAHQIKYLGHDVLTCGLMVNEADTLQMLFDWADKIIVTDKAQEKASKKLADKGYPIELWDMGPDMVNGKSLYPRPFNKELLAKAQALVREHRHEL